MWPGFNRWPLSSPDHVSRDGSPPNPAFESGPGVDITRFKSALYYSVAGPAKMSSVPRCGGVATEPEIFV